MQVVLQGSSGHQKTVFAVDVMREQKEMKKEDGEEANLIKSRMICESIEFSFLMRWASSIIT